MLAQLIAVISLLWVGMIMGISLASWVKFHAGSLTKPIGLEVGRVVFAMFNKAQGVLLVFIIIISLFAHLTAMAWLLICGLILILSLQCLWLFPLLRNRVDIIIAGGNPTPSHVHAWYGAAELIKITLLLILSIKFIYT